MKAATLARRRFHAPYPLICWAIAGTCLLVPVPGCISYGGQCSAPYELDVYFQPGTSLQAASSALQSCQRDPTVISIVSPRMNKAGRIMGEVETRDFLRTSKTQHLLNCLTGSPSVQSAVWPD